MEGTEGAAVEAKDDTAKRHTYALVRNCDMIDDMKTEAMEVCATACEKFANNNEGAARFIKETLDKKFGPAWHVVVGEGYGFEITHEVKNILYMFFGGAQAILLWKCA